MEVTCVMPEICKFCYEARKNLTGINIHRTQCFLLARSFIHFNVCDFFLKAISIFLPLFIYAPLFFCAVEFKHTLRVAATLLHIVVVSLLVWYSLLHIKHSSVVDLHNNFHLSLVCERYASHTKNYTHETFSYISAYTKNIYSRYASCWAWEGVILLRIVICF